MYEDFYQLRAKPFRLSPDPGFFFASRGHKRALAYLRYGLSQDEGFVVITGAPGTGKTTLAQILLKEMDQSHLVVAHLTTSQLEAEELLRMVLASFGLRYDGVNKAGMLKTMEAFLLARSRERKRVLLVVDEAQNLPPSALEELRMLSNLQIGDKALLQTFLLGQAQFRSKLDHPDLEQFRQRVIANYHLSELGEDECQSYIETRLRHVGWTGNPSFSNEAYKGIYKYTQGIPRRINMLCDRLLLFGFLEERSQIDETVFNEVTDELQQEISGKPVERKSTANTEADTMNTVLDEQKKNRVTARESEIVNKHDIQDTVNEVLHKAPENSSAPVATQPEGSKLSKAAPDVGYDEVITRAQTDKSETSEDQNKERFQVITGGRDESDIKVDNVTIPLTPSENNSKSADKVARSDVQEESQDVVLRKILRLVLAYHRSPRSFPGLQDPSQPLPNGITQILALANSDDDTLKNFRQIAVMGISPAMLRAAVRFFVRRVLFLPGGDEYRVLGLTSGASQDQVEGHYGLLMRLMRQEKRSAEESSVNRIGEAYENLCKGIVVRAPKEPANEDSALSDFDTADIAKEDKLDLDLAPVGMDRPREGERIFEPKTFALDHHLRDTSGIITTKEKSRFKASNIMLILGAVVVVGVLYFTQLPNTPAPDTDKEIAAIAETPDKQTENAQAENSQPQNAQPQNTQSQSTQSQDTQTGQVATSTTPEAVSNADSTSTDTNAEERHQNLLAELRENSKEQDKAAQQAEAAKQKKLKEELKQAALAKAASEKKAEQEAAAQAKARAAAKAKAEAEAKAAAQAKAKAKAAASARAELKARQEAEARARAAGEAKAAAVKEAEAKTKLAQAAVASPDTSTESSADQASAMTSSDSKAEPNNVIARLERAYTAGNLNDFINLFSRHPRTNNHTDVAGLRDEYRSFFTTTDLRNLTIRNIDWDIESSYALGNGTYEQIVKNRDKPVKTLKKGKVTIQLEDLDGQMKISRLYFSDPDSVSVLKVDTSPLATEGVLNEMLNKFVKTYEDGKIEPFMSLFSENAKTNDRDNLAGIRKDYDGLFSGTSMRKMTLKDMKWKWEDGTAKSTGAFTVEVQPKGKEKTSVYKGKLWFEVTLIKGQPKISYFAFETQ